MYQDTKDLLMDVDAMDFVNDYDKQLDTHTDDFQQGLTDTSESSIDEEDSMERDPVTGDVMAKLTSSKYLPLEQEESGKLKFKLSSLSSHNIAYLTEKDQYNLYPTKETNVDNTPQFSYYVSKLFEIYEGLGDDRTYSVPTIGVINSTYGRDHTAAVNLAMETLVTELEYFIETVQSEKVAISRYLELDECLTILHCLKTIHFTLDTPEDQEIRKSFIAGLLEWINRSDGEPDAEFVEHVFNSNSDKNVFESSVFWKLINRLLLRGLFEQALGCIERSRIITYLESSCETSANALKDLTEIIKQYPIDSMETFREWKSLVLELGQTYSNSETNISGELRDHIEDTLLLVSGDRSKILNYSKMWYESFCGFILYYIPTLELADEYLQLSIERNPVDITNNWEDCCVNIIRGNIHLTLPILESLDNCTAAFTSGICEAKGLLENFYAENDDDMDLNDNIISEDLFSRRNGMAHYLMTNFAFDLCSYDNKELWPVAIGLISLLPTDTTSAKKTAIGELLQHYPYQTNDDIEWMLSVCAKWKLSYVAKSLFTRLGSSMMYEGKTIEAMTNFSKAGKFDLVKDYSWTLFEAATINGRPLEDEILTAIIKSVDIESDNSIIISQEILDNLVTDAMRQTLAPYAILYQFYEAKRDGNLIQALELLVALINFQYLPNYYLVMLISKFLYPIFLHDDAQLIEESTVVDIISAIETKWDSSDIKSQNIYKAILDTDEELNKSLPEDLSDLLKIVREKLNFKLCKEFMQ